MALAANALVDLQTAKEFLIVPGPSDDAVIEATINRATTFCENWCKRPLKTTTLTAVRLMGRSWSKLPLRATPVNAAATITVSLDGIPQTVWRTEADGDPATFDVVLGSFNPDGGRGPDHLYRAGGWLGSLAQPYNVLVTYTGGFAVVPGDLQLACLYIVQKFFRDAKRQLAEVASINTPMGGFSVLDNAIPRAADLLLRPYEFSGGVG